VSGRVSQMPLACPRDAPPVPLGCPAAPSAWWLPHGCGRLPGPFPGGRRISPRWQFINRGSPRLTTLTPEELAALENPDIIAIDQSGSQPSTAVISGNIEAVRKELNEKGNADQSDQDSVG
jgi:hypothetical protein